MADKFRSIPLHNRITAVRKRLHPVWQAVCHQRTGKGALVIRPLHACALPLEAEQNAREWRKRPPLKTGARDNSLGVETALGEIGPAGQLSVRRSAARQAGEGTRLNPDTANPDMAGRGLGTI